MKNKTKGILFLLVPILSLLAVFTTHAIMRSIWLTQMADTIVEDPITLQPEATFTSGMQITNVILSLLGIVAVIAILIGIPFGIYFLTKKETQLTPEHLVSLRQKPPYKNLTDEQITFIHKWSWGAFWATPIWAIANKLYLWAILALIPVINLYPWIKLSIDGRKIAWEQREWINLDQFKNRQIIAAWAIFILIVVLFSLEYLGY